MRIEDLKSDTKGDCFRVAATVIWEVCDRSPLELYFETEGVAALDLESDPHAFLVGCLLPAMQSGEKRIRIDEPICPELLTGLETNMRWFEHWTGGQMQPLQIECSRSRTDLSARPEQHVGSFLSGGVDSLATLRRNHLNFPHDHSAAIRDCIIVHGFDIGGMSDTGKEKAYFERSLAALREIALDAEINLIPIMTNVRLLQEDVAFWMEYFHGGALASVAHVLSGRLMRMHIASGSLKFEGPWGSHPLIDPNYGSHGLQITHDGMNLNRLEKARCVAEWDVGLRNLRVCTWNPEAGLNCGVCEKCLRTMLELLAVGKLKEAESFPKQHIDMEVLDTLQIHVDYEVTLYEELLAPLAAAGEDEIVERIQAKIAEFKKRQVWEQERDWKGVIKRFDRRFLDSGLYRMYGALRPYLVKRPPEDTP